MQRNSLQSHQVSRTSVIKEDSFVVRALSFWLRSNDVVLGSRTTVVGRFEHEQNQNFR